MARGLRLNGAQTWVAMATALALLSLGAALAAHLTAPVVALGSAAPDSSSRVTSNLPWAWHADEPLRVVSWWTAALVHHGPWHLAANVGAAAAVAAYGAVAWVERRDTLAWLAAWPLAQALLITDPGSLTTYAGLSATLHAGVAIVCWRLIVQPPGARRLVGGLVSAAVAVKLVLEAPSVQAAWQGLSVQALPPTALPGAPGHVLAGHAHLCGVAAGLIAACAVEVMVHRRRRAAPPLPP